MIRNGWDDRYIDPVSWSQVPPLAQDEASSYAEVSNMDLDVRPVEIEGHRGALFARVDCTDVGAPASEADAWTCVLA